MTGEPFTVRWGILATGGIAKTFTKDLLIDPSTRGATDIRHELVAAATSNSASRAQEFLDIVKASSSAKAYGSYRELVNDKDVDIIYIATPHSHHYQHTRLALEAGKHVLVEKSITVNAQQCKILCDIAKERKLFLMEAVWTRFFPVAREITSIIQKGELGEIKRVFADFSFWNDVEKDFGTSHRMVNLDLAGGAMLDLGIYSLTWVFVALYNVLPKEKRSAPVVASSISKYEKTGADEQTSIILNFPGGAHGIATTSIRVASQPNASHPSADPIRIQGTLGDLTVNYAPKPTSYTLTPASSASRGTPASFEYGTTRHEIPGGGNGMFWEADECARCIRDGKLQSEVMGWEESQVMMQVMDKVREQGGLVYPAGIESVEYPVEGL